MARIFIAIRFDEGFKRGLVALQDALKARGVQGNVCRGQSSQSGYPRISRSNSRCKTMTQQNEESEYEKFRREQIEQFEDDITEGRCYPEMPEGQFIRSK